MMRLARLALACSLLAAAHAALAQFPSPYVKSQGGGGGADLSTAICTAPIACAAGTWSWAGATVTGTPALGDFSYWTGANTQGLVTNASGAAGQVVEWQSGAASIWGGPALNRIKAANAANTLANGNSTGQVWNWANTADSTVAFTVGETSAATNGTSTAGVPNQVLFKLNTAAASTQSPLSVYSRASHVFSVSPSTAQIFATNGSNSLPTYSFASSTTTGFYTSGSNLRFAVSGADKVIVDANAIYVPQGNSTNPGLTDSSFSQSGLAWNIIANANLSVMYGNKEYRRVNAGGHMNSVAQTGVNIPTMGACGTSPSITGTDEAMVVTVGTGGAATACVVNFGTSFVTNAPICNVTSNTVADAALAITAVSVSSLTVTKAAAFTASSKLYIRCVGSL